MGIAPSGGSYHDGDPDSFGGPPELGSRGALGVVVVVFLPGDQRQANNINTPQQGKLINFRAARARAAGRVCFRNICA